MTAPTDALRRLLTRLAAAGVAEPSTLVVEFASGGMPQEWGGMPMVGTAMSSRVPCTQVPEACVFEGGLVEGYVTLEIQPVNVDLPQADSAIQTAMGLTVAVERVRASAVPVRRFVATGFGRTGPEPADMAFLHKLADVLDARIRVRPCPDILSVGASILEAFNPPRPENSHYSSLLRRLAAPAIGAEGVVRRGVAAARRFRLQVQALVDT